MPLASACGAHGRGEQMSTGTTFNFRKTQGHFIFFPIAVSFIDAFQMTTDGGLVP